jgi:hypothetical protein
MLIPGFRFQVSGFRFRVPVSGFSNLEPGILKLELNK